VKAYLESIKHYPTSKEARLQRPRGSVTVWIVIDRSGGMKEAGIDESSGSLILDGAALSTVRNASYPGFPASAFQGQATHRFTVQLNYSMN
jgi:protein TonB